MFWLKLSDLNETANCQIFLNETNWMNNIEENFSFAQRFKFTNRQVFPSRCTISFFSLFLFFSGSPPGPVAHRAGGGVCMKEIPLSVR